MKLSEAVEKGTNGYWVSANLRKNPRGLQEWFVMMLNSESKQFMLVDEEEIPIVNSDLNELSTLLKRIGIPEFSVYL